MDVCDSVTAGEYEHPVAALLYPQSPFILMCCVCVCVYCEFSPVISELAIQINQYFIGVPFSFWGE
jgi:hypothetical protein